jgi:Protein of unknown function (DUF3592)
VQTRLWRGRRFDLVGWLLLGSVGLVWWRWSSLSWHARGMILAAYGVVFVLVMLPQALRTRGLLKTGARAEGTVVGADERTRIQRDDVVTDYYPQVRFTTAEGRQVVFTSSFGSPGEPELGDRLRVRYRPDDPQQAEVDHAITWMLRAAFGVVGGLGLLIAGVVVYAQPSRDLPAGTVTRIEGTGQVRAVPASGRIGEMLTVYDRSGAAQVAITVTQLKFSAGDQFGQPAHGLFLGAYVRLHAVVDEPDVPDISVLVGERFYEEAATFSAAFDPALDYLMLESGDRASGWLVFDVPDRHGQLVLRDPGEHKVGVWTY